MVSVVVGTAGPDALEENKKYLAPTGIQAQNRPAPSLITTSKQKEYK